MPETSDLTVVVAGPLAQRSPLLATLAHAGCTIEPHQGTRGHHHGFPDLRDDPTLGTIAVRCPDVDQVKQLAEQAGWALRWHGPTPDCPVCGGTGHATTAAGAGACLHCAGTGRSNQPAPTAEQVLRAELDEIKAKLAALEGR